MTISPLVAAELREAENCITGCLAAQARRIELARFFDLMTTDRKANLPRLERHQYQGHAVVFWTNTLEERSRGWLTPEFYTHFREIILHTAIRYALWCPAYCVMPDHVHHLWMGMHPQSDQLLAIKFLRSELRLHLGAGRNWQHQAHDHVLRDEERRRNAFRLSCAYILQNPVRGQLVSRPEDWPYQGVVIPGFPRMRISDDGFWERFWRIYADFRDSEAIRPFAVGPLDEVSASHSSAATQDDGECSRLF